MKTSICTYTKFIEKIFLAYLFTQSHESIDSTTSKDHTGTEECVELEAHQNGNNSHTNKIFEKIQIQKKLPSIQSCFLPVGATLAKLGDSFDKIYEHAAEWSFQCDDKKSAYPKDNENYQKQVVHLYQNSDNAAGTEGDQSEGSEENG